MFQPRRPVPPVSFATTHAAAAAAAAPAVAHAAPPVPIVPAEPEPAEPEPAEPLVAIGALALPRLLHVHPDFPAGIDYHVSSRDIIAAIHEQKNTFISLLLNNDSLPAGGSSREEQLWEQANELTFQRLTAYLEHTIRERQRRIIADYATTLRAANNPAIDIDFLNTSLSVTVAEGEPFYAV